MLNVVSRETRTWSDVPGRSAYSSTGNGVGIVVILVAAEEGSAEKMNEWIADALYRSAYGSATRELETYPSEKKRTTTLPPMRSEEIRLIQIP
jgi:hypothetical protein